VYRDAALDRFTECLARSQRPATARPTPQSSPAWFSEASGANVNRRAFVSRAAPAVLSGAVFVAGGRGFSPAARAQTVNGLDLADPGPLPDHVLGSPTAPVTIIEYVSMTCGHCAMFAIDTFPELKAQFIDTGKVRYIVREFPIDGLAAVAAMLIRSAGDDKYYDTMAELFRQQRQWTTGGRIQQLMTLAVTKLGFTEASFDACLTDQQLLDRIAKARDRAGAFGVRSAPTFFVNGEKHAGFATIDEMKRLIALHLKN
jgi:protein-disulfide isomerase